MQISIYANRLFQKDSVRLRLVQRGNNGCPQWKPPNEQRNRFRRLNNQTNKNNGRKQN